MDESKPPDHEPAEPRRDPKSVIRLPLDSVDRINRWRVQYIVAYVLWFGVQLYLYVKYAGNPETNVPTLWEGAAATLLLIFFYIRFVGVLRMMGYVAWTYLPACLLAIMPIPGVLVVAYLDRTITKTLRKGLAAREEALKRESSNE